MTTGTISGVRIVDALGTPLELEWRELGAGEPPILLLHGARGFSADDLLLSALAEGRRVIAPSHPGYGETARPDWMDSVSDLAHFYLELIEQCDLRDVTVIGCSIGGWIAAEMAAWRRERIGRMVLIDPVGIRIGGPTDRDIADIFAISPDEHVALTFHDPVHAGPPLAELPPDEILRRMRGEEATAMYCWEPYMCNPKLRRRLASVNVPTLIIWGAHDGVVAVDYGRAFAESVPDARFEVVADAAHWPHIEQPGVVVRHIETFISQTRDAHPPVPKIPAATNE
jgi:pimeloyl-ACP methyl ester carboxylesterase